MPPSTWRVGCQCTKAESTVTPRCNRCRKGLFLDVPALRRAKFNFKLFGLGRMVSNSSFQLDCSSSHSRLAIGIGSYPIGVETEIRVIVRQQLLAQLLASLKDLERRPQ